MKNIYLHLNTRDEFLRMDISKIVYFEADGNYTNIMLANKGHVPKRSGIGFVRSPR